MENYLQQFKGISLIKRDSFEIELASDLIKFTNLQIYKFTNLQIYKFTNLQIYKFTNLQIYKFTNLQIYKISFQICQLLKMPILRYHIPVIDSSWQGL
jgi:hypothetical protein